MLPYRSPKLSQKFYNQRFDAKDLEMIKTLGMGYFGKVLLAELLQTNIPNNKLNYKKLGAIKKVKGKLHAIYKTFLS